MFQCTSSLAALEKRLQSKITLATLLGAFHFMIGFAIIQKNKFKNTPNAQIDKLQNG